MNIALRIIIDLLLTGGIFFALSGVVGMLRLKETLSRIQASTTISTLGLFLTALGCFLHAVFVEHNSPMAVKIVLIVVFILLTNPVANHAISRAAYRRGLGKEQEDLVRDDFGRDKPYAD